MYLDRSPLVRMWMEDPDENGWGDPSTMKIHPLLMKQRTVMVTETNFKHPATQLRKNYFAKSVKHWIEDSSDGFLWI